MVPDDRNKDEHLIISQFGGKTDQGYLAVYDGQVHKCLI